jgi:GNAT superfamily N-acetyltransferase
VAGFACYNAKAPGFFGPEGVAPERRNRGIGRALLIRTLHAMWEAGYPYAIIGAAGPQEFYAKTVGAIPIPDSFPGFYRNPISRSLRKA